MARAGERLFELESLNNGLLGAIELILAGSKVYPPPHWFGTIEDQGRILGVGIYSRPDGLLATDLPLEALEQVIHSMEHAVGAPHRILAPVKVSQGLAEQWTKVAAVRSALDQIWNVYELHTLIQPERSATGNLRLGQDSESDIIKQWGRLYGEEKPAPVDVAEFMLRKLSRGELYVWDDDGPTTLITLSGFTDNGVRISSVYTPVEFRGKGYASSAVAALSADLLEQGRKFLTLVAVEDDPAERIYQRLGFERIGQRACYNLIPLLHDLK